jgi:hypothetical protein
VFLSRIEAVTTSAEFEEVVVRGGGVASRRAISASDSIRVSTTGVIEGASIAGHWTDPATRRTFALAALDRRAAVDALRARLDNVDATTARILASAPPEDRVGLALALLRASEISRRRIPLLAQLRVLDAKAELVSHVDHASLYTRAGAALAGLRVLMPEDVDTEVADGIRRGLLESGLRTVVHDPATADLVVSASVALDPPVRIDGWTWVRFSVTGHVQESKEGRVLARFAYAAREGSLLLSEARARAGRRLADGVSQEIVRSLSQSDSGLDK